MRKLLIIITIFLSVLLLTGCENNDFKKGTIEGYSYEESDEVTNYVKIVTNNDKVILVELYPEIAPLTVSHFQDLVKEKFYDNKIFHRVIANFVIQTGSPEGNNYTSYGDTIKGEFKNNGIENNLKHEEGVLSMVRSSNDMDSASSQFFICVNSNEEINYLDGDYAAFGKVIAGYEAVEEISKVKTDVNDKPVTPQKMVTVRFINITNN